MTKTRRSSGACPVQVALPLWCQNSNATHETQKQPIFKEDRYVKAASREWIDRIVSHLESRFDSKTPSAAELAQQMHFSARQFSRKLKAITGLSTGRFIREVQLQKAKYILEEGVVFSITDVAYDCGFELPSTFSTLFKKRYGKAPVEYFREHRLA